jgi:hypothetical protein
MCKPMVGPQQQGAPSAWVQDLLAVPVAHTVMESQQVVEVGQVVIPQPAGRAVYLGALESLVQVAVAVVAAVVIPVVLVAAAELDCLVRVLTAPAGQSLVQAPAEVLVLMDHTRLALPVPLEFYLALAEGQLINPAAVIQVMAAGVEHLLTQIMYQSRQDHLM